MQDELKKTLEKYIELVDSEENQRREQFWQPEPVYCRDKFRRIPRPWRETGYAPVVADPGPTMWAKIFNFNLREYYTDPEVYLLNYLKIMIAQFELNDDTTLHKVLPFWPGVTFEAALFGMETIYHDTEDPWLGRELVLKEKKDLNKLKPPDFYESGLMPLVHHLYQEINEWLKGTGCSLAFPELIRSPWGLAFQLRGFAELAVDCMEDPTWVHALMRFLTEARKQWYEERSRFLGEPVPPGHLYNDEVDCNVIGPNIYKKYILPYEIELSEFHGGIVYWHSCGNITPVLGLVRQIPNLAMINISSWTDYRKAAEVCPDIALEICVRPTDDVYLADQAKVEKKIGDIVEACVINNVHAFCLRAGSLQQFSDSVPADLAKAKEWVAITKSKVQVSLNK